MVTALSQKQYQPQPAQSQAAENGADQETSSTNGTASETSIRVVEQAPLRNSAEPTNSGQLKNSAELRLQKNHEVIANMNNKRRVATYNGKDSSVHIDSWFNIFEIIMHDKTHDELKYQVCQYIDGDALTWFSQHIVPSLKTLSWTQIKESFTRRFKSQEIRPIIAAQERRLEKGETVQKYFDDKMRLLQQTALEDLDMVAVLNHGMPHYYRSLLICANIQSTFHWLTTTLELESNFKKQEKFRRPFKPTSDSKALVANASVNKDAKAKKPSACRICIKKGIANQLHWHNECPNRDPNWERIKKGLSSANESCSAKAPSTAHSENE